VINAPEHPFVPGAPSAWLLIARRVNYFILYYVIISVISNRKLLEYALLALVLGGIATCLAGIYEIITAEQFLKAIPTGRDILVTTKLGSVRVQGLESDADVHATFLLVGLAFLFYFLYWAFSWKTVGLSILAILYVANIIATGSRGAWLGLILVFLVCFLFLKDPRKWRVFVAGCILVVVIFGALTFNPNTITVEKLQQGVSPSTKIRYGLLLMGWEMVKDYPFLGIGTGGFPNNYHHYFPAVSSLVRNRPWDCLNGYMKVWAENGTMGLLIFLTMLFFVFFEAWSVFFTVPQASAKTLGISLLAGYAVILWLLAVFPVLDGKYMWLSISLCIAYSNIIRQETGEKSSI
jgi:O-antigen ligase